jgi:hypothetical protein
VERDRPVVTNSGTQIEGGATRRAEVGVRRVAMAAPVAEHAHEDQTSVSSM